MKSILSYFEFHRWLSLALAITLTMSLVTANLSFSNSIVDSNAITTTLSDERSNLITGAGATTCGIAAGIVIGIALGAGTVTVGIGTALVLSAGLHLTAGMCVGSKY